MHGLNMIGHDLLLHNILLEFGNDLIRCNDFLCLGFYQNETDFQDL